jgi:uncharacterized protein
MTAPRSLLVLWPTSRCNLACRYCYAAGAGAADMAVETACRAIDLMGQAPLAIQFAGGEPLLNTRVIEAACAYAADRLADVRFAIQTNGTCLDGQAAELIKCYRMAVGVSLDGRPDINEHLRGNTSGTVSGIRLLAAHNLAVNLNAVVCDANVDSLDGLVDMAAYLGSVRGIGLDLLRLAGRAAAWAPDAVGTANPVAAAPADAPAPPAPPAPAGPQELEAALMQLHRHLGAVNAGLVHKLVVREFERARVALRSARAAASPRTAAPAPQPYCHAAEGRSFVVLPDGECYPCGSLAGQAAYRMGNVHRSVLPLSIACTPPADCAGCEHQGYCPGGCPSRGLLNGGFDRLDCVMRKTTYRLIKEES